MSSNAMSAGPGPIIPICEFQESPSSMRGLVLEVRPGLAECLSETFRNEYRIIAKAGGASDLSRHGPSNCPSEDPRRNVDGGNGYRGLKVGVPFPLIMHQTKDAVQPYRLVDV